VSGVLGDPILAVAPDAGDVEFGHTGLGRHGSSLADGTVVGRSHAAAKCCRQVGAGGGRAERLRRDGRLGRPRWAGVHGEFDRVGGELPTARRGGRWGRWRSGGSPPRSSPRRWPELAERWGAEEDHQTYSRGLQRRLVDTDNAGLQGNCGSPRSRWRPTWTGVTAKTAIPPRLTAAPPTPPSASASSPRTPGPRRATRRAGAVAGAGTSSAAGTPPAANAVVRSPDG
jgi:hypothetical protein